jgi:hypothetical protein
LPACAQKAGRSAECARQHSLTGNAHANPSQVRMKHVVQYSIERETDRTVRDQNDAFDGRFSFSICNPTNEIDEFSYKIIMP